MIIARNKSDLPRFDSVAFVFPQNHCQNDRRINIVGEEASFRARMYIVTLEKISRSFRAVYMYFRVMIIMSAEQTFTFRRNNF